MSEAGNTAAGGPNLKPRDVAKEYRKNGQPISKLGDLGQKEAADIVAYFTGNIFCSALFADVP